MPPYRHHVTDSDHCVAPTPDPAPSDDALERLAAALNTDDFATTLVTGTGRRPRLTVTSKRAGLDSDVYTGSGYYWWSWAERIAPTADPHAAAGTISSILGGLSQPAHD